MGTGGLGTGALEHYTDVADIKRVLANIPQGTPNSVNPEFLISYFGSLRRLSRNS